jgi:hypothetical protein
MVMRWCLKELSEGRPKALYAAGGKFLIGTSAFAGWESMVGRMQSELDRWAWRDFGGELVFHLTAAPFDAGKIPHTALQTAMEDRRNRPLEKALVSPNGWAADEFFQRAASGDGKCDACGMTRQVHANADDERVCDACIKDEEIGKKLCPYFSNRGGRPGVSGQPHGAMRQPGYNFRRRLAGLWVWRKRGATLVLVSPCPSKFSGLSNGF